MIAVILTVLGVFVIVISVSIAIPNHKTVLATIVADVIVTREMIVVMTAKPRVDVSVIIVLIAPVPTAIAMVVPIAIVIVIFHATIVRFDITTQMTMRTKMTTMRTVIVSVTATIVMTATTAVMTVASAIVTTVATIMMNNRRIPMRAGLSELLTKSEGRRRQIFRLRKQTISKAIEFKPPLTGMGA